MKCSKCGSDMEGKDFCSTCGAPGEALTEKMEVEYKVFKKSELLEIGRKRDEKTQKAVTKVRPKVATREASAEFTDLSGKKKLFVVIAVFLLAAVIGCALYFWRFLFSE